MGNESASASVPPKSVAKAPSALHAVTVEELIARFDAHPVRGLEDDAAAKRLAKNGPNELPTPPGPSPIKQILAQFANPIVLTLLVAAVIATINGASAKATESFLVRYGDAIAIAIIVVLNAVLGFYQERRAEQALEALKKMQTPNARVRRSDIVKIVPASDVGCT